MEQFTGVKEKPKHLFIMSRLKLQVKLIFDFSMTFLHFVGQEEFVTAQQEQNTKKRYVQSKHHFYNVL